MNDLQTAARAMLAAMETYREQATRDVTVVEYDHALVITMPIPAPWLPVEVAAQALRKAIAAPAKAIKVRTLRCERCGSGPVWRAITDGHAIGCPKGHGYVEATGKEMARARWNDMQRKRKQKGA